MSTPSVQLSARTWQIRSVQVQVGNSGPIPMSGPKLRVASGSQEDPIHRWAEQEAPREEIPKPLTTEAVAARGYSLQHLRRTVAVSISRSACPASSSTATAAGGAQEQPKLEGERPSIFSTRSTTYPSEAKMERNHSKRLDPNHTRTCVPTLTPAHLRTWPTLCLYPGNREGQYGVPSCQSLAEAPRCAPLM